MARNRSKTNIKKPNLCGTLAKTNWSHSTSGTVAGCVILFLTLIDLAMFLSNITDDHDPIYEYLGKILNTSINFLGFLAAVVAFFKIQKLRVRRSPLENTVDLFLLDLGRSEDDNNTCATVPPIGYH